MKKYVYLLLFSLASQYSFAANILVIGDSHTAGPFGQQLKKELQIKHNVAVYGHSSSAAINWVEEKITNFSGGIYHGAFVSGVDLLNPAPVHWREKVATPKLKDFLSNMLKYEGWTNTTGPIKPDVAVIALGANDLRAIANPDGSIRSSYDFRQKALLNILDQLDENQMKCFWIGPPDSVMKPSAQQDTLYNYLLEAIGNRCEFFNSRHYVAKKWLEACDGVHFSCNKESYRIAAMWAQEVKDFINNNL